jgi:hypothetical protein
MVLQAVLDGIFGRIGEIVEIGQVETLIAAIATWIKENSTFLTKTKLLKLLYLFDLAYFQTHGEIFTGFSWKFFHLGPWASEYDPTLQGMMAAGLLAQQVSNSETIFYRPTNRVELAQALPSLKDEVLLKTILKQWGDKSTGEILDHVYFQTAPMEAAVRNQPLDFSSVPQSSGSKYERVASGAKSSEIRKLKTAFEKRRVERNAGKPTVRMTPPNYDEDFERAMATLEGIDL